MSKKDKRQQGSSKSSSKKFDTTTTLNINETFDGDEITLKEEMPDPKDLKELKADEDDSVTQKLERKCVPYAFPQTVSHNHPPKKKR